MWVDEAFAAIVGHKVTDLVGRTFEAITHVDDVNLDSQLAKRLLDGDLDHYEMEKRYMHRDGSVISIHLSVNAVRDRLGRILYAISTVEPVAVQASAAADGPMLSPQELELDRIRRAVLG